MHPLATTSLGALIAITAIFKEQADAGANISPRRTTRDYSMDANAWEQSYRMYNSTLNEKEDMIYVYETDTKQTREEWLLEQPVELTVRGMAQGIVSWAIYRGACQFCSSTQHRTL